MALNITSTANISSTATYKLVNSWSHGALALEPGVPDLQLCARSPNSSDSNGNSTVPLEFQFRTTDSSGDFNLCAAVHDQTYCLDVYNVQKTVPHLTPFGYYSGQYWTVQPVDGEVRLSNEWTGAGWFLDVYEGSYNTFLSNDADYAGHYWTLEQVAENVALPPNAPAVDDSMTDGSAGSGNSGLSTPAIIGISLGGGIFSATIVLVALALLFRRYRRKCKYDRDRLAAIEAAEHPVDNNRQQFNASPNSQTILDPMGNSNSNSTICGQTNPQTANCNVSSVPVELESPMEARCAVHHGTLSYFPQRNGQQPRGSVYELPANYENLISPVPSPKPSHAGSLHRQYNADEKDPTLFNQQNPHLSMMTTTTMSSTVTSSLPTSPVSARSRATYQTARWEEVVPNGRGEIVFSTNGMMASRASRSLNTHAGAGTFQSAVSVTSAPREQLPQYHHSQQDQQQRDYHSWANGNTNPTWPSSPSASSSHTSSPVNGGTGTCGVNDWYANTALSELHAPPPAGFEGWGSIFEADAGVDGDVGRQVHEAGGREVFRMVDLPASPDRDGRGDGEVRWAEAMRR
ncbi:hypothetical protein DIS24_g1048 [Lasiodiplodia hormozganensis]|uniref:Uncharacterized protein n=1 Tax=Lasiodiplodia hormozganensis TaxID=869390 RepID=A0AA39Z4F6_9PEZI|nr:hypothetical protein DIS24_g1048 [Lasiodiplodia hormozganensis]